MSYYLNPAVSNSSLSYIDPETGGCPEKFKDYLDGKLDDEKTPSLEKGDYIHKFLLTPDEFHPLTIEMPAPSVANVVKRLFYDASRGMDAAQQATLELSAYKDKILDMAKAENYQSNWKDETRVNKILETGTELWNALRSAGDKTILDGELYETILKCARSIRNNEAANILLLDTPGHECFNELEIYWDSDVDGQILSFKAKLDRLVVDHEKKTYSIIDFKTTSKFIHNFPDSVAYYRYYRQIAFYEWAVRVWMTQKGWLDYTAEDHYIVAVETKGYFMSRVYILSEGYLDMGRDQIRSLITRIAYHIKVLDWVKPMEESMDVYKTYVLIPEN